MIATAWGGPADYLDESCGILVPVKDRAQLCTELGAAILRLACDPELSRVMGEAGRNKVELIYDWERKVDRIVEIYEEAIGSNEKSA